MKKLLSLFFFSYLVFTINAQSIERKMVISGGVFFYTTIDEEFQMATLHKGKFSATLKSEKKLALPAGRNYNHPVVPFSWDVLKTNFYGISFLTHPLNDRNEALKRLPISDLKEWSDKVTIPDMLMKSVDQNMFAYNDPYLFILKRSNVLDHFFYDGIALNDSSYMMAIANNGELSIWNYNGINWQHGTIQSLPTDDYFSLFAVGKKAYLAAASGQIYEIVNNTVMAVSVKAIGEPLNNGFLIVNKDDRSVYFMKNSQLDKTTPLNKQLRKKAIKLF
jgi:hypothetical protein